MKAQHKGALSPGLLGEGFGCGFVKTAKGYSNENSLRGKGEHCMDSHRNLPKVFGKDLDQQNSTYVTL